MSLIWRATACFPRYGQQLVVTEGVFSMDGDSARPTGKSSRKPTAQWLVDGR
ncbi:hypothetical protein ACLK1T_02805 [Escherichia coli]